MMDIGAVHLAQQDGGAPTALAAGSAPGESGVSLLGLLRFDCGMHVVATPRCHCICFQMSPGRVEKRMAGRVDCVERPVGSLTDRDDKNVHTFVGIGAKIESSRILSSRSIRVGWRWQPRRARCLRRS
jgi:hypothetical protein